MPVVLLFLLVHLWHLEIPESLLPQVKQVEVVVEVGEDLELLAQGQRVRLSQVVVPVVVLLEVPLVVVSLRVVRVVQLQLVAQAIKLLVVAQAIRAVQGHLHQVVQLLNRVRTEQGER